MDAKITNSNENKANPGNYSTQGFTGDPKDPATISKWVTNTSQPTLENLIEIARCLKCDMNDLVRLEETVTIDKPSDK